MQRTAAPWKPLSLLLWPAAGAVAAAIYLDAPHALRAAQGNHDSVAPVVVPLFLLAAIGAAAVVSAGTGCALWFALRRRFLLAALVNVALWTGILAFAQSPPGRAWMQSGPAPVDSRVVRPLPACSEPPPADGQERKTWDYECAGRNAPALRRD